MKWVNFSSVFSVMKKVDWLEILLGRHTEESDSSHITQKLVHNSLLSNVKFYEIFEKYVHQTFMKWVEFSVKNTSPIFIF